MGDKIRYERVLAEEVGREVMALLEGTVERIEIAGSIRRGKDMVGDVELLYVPFAVDAAAVKIKELADAGDVLTYRLNKNGNRMFGGKNKFLVHVPTGIPVDVFATPARYWGMALVVRTGPAEFNRRLFTEFRRKGMRAHAYGGVTVADGAHMNCTSEETVFELVRWPYIPPALRDE